MVIDLPIHVGDVTGRLRDITDTVTDLPAHVGDVTGRLRDITDTVTDLPAHVGDVTGRLRDITDTATAKARRAAPSRRWALPAGLAILGLGIGAGLFVWLRSRRSTTSIEPTLSDTLVHA